MSNEVENNHIWLFNVHSDFDAGIMLQYKIPDG